MSQQRDGPERSIPPEFQATADTARQQYQQEQEAQRLKEEADQGDRTEYEQEREKTNAIGRWAAQLLVEAGVARDAFETVVTQVTRGSGRSRDKKQQRHMCLSAG